MPLALIPILLLVVPVVEITVFILVGNLIGLWPTLGLVVLTAVIGSMLLRRQGLGILLRIQEETRQGRVPGRELVNGLMVAVAGVLLLTPGLVTDTIGFLLFLPPVRDAVWRFAKKRVVVVGGNGFSRAARGPGGAGPRPAGGFARGPASGPDVVDLSGDEYRRAPDASSPWHDGNETDGNGGTGGRTLH